MTNYNNLSFLKDYSLPEKLSDIIYFSFNKKEESDFKKVIKKVEEKMRAEIKQIEEQIITVQEEIEKEEEKENND